MNPSAIPNPNQAQQPNSFERLLPTIGGTAGSIIGGIAGGVGGFGAGAAIPGADLTGVPEVAGAGLGAKYGSTAGAGVGGGIGQAAEDFLTHNFNGGSAGRIGGSALENAIGNFTGEKLIQGGSKILGGITSFLGKQAADRGAAATAETAAQAAAKKTAEDAAAAEAKANAYKNNYGSISDRLQRDLNLGTNAKTVDSMGYDSTNPAEMKTVSNAGLDLNTVYDGALKNAPDVDMSGFGTKVFADMQKNGITDLSTTPLGKAISEAEIPLNQSNLSLPATQVRKLQQAVGTQIGNTQRLINNAETQGVSNTEAEAQLKSLQSTYQELGTKIKTPEVDAAIAKTTVSDADRQALVAKYGDTLGNHVADTINGATSANDLLKPMQSYTQMSHAADMATNDIENAVGTARAVARTKADLPTAEPAPKPGNPAGGILDALSMGLAIPTHGASLLGLLPHVIQGVKSPAVQDAALAGLNGITNSAAKKIVPAVTRAGAITAANLPNEVPRGVGAGGQSAIPAAATAGVGGPGPLVQALQNETEDQNALINRSAMTPANFGGDSLAGSAVGLGGVVANLAPLVQKQDLAGQALSGLLPSFENAGGAQGALGGLISQASGLVPGSAAATYQHNQTTAAAALASLLGISPQEAAGLLPQLTQNQNTAGNSEGVLRGIMGNVNPGGGSAIPTLGIPQLSLGQ